MYLDNESRRGILMRRWDSSVSLGHWYFMPGLAARPLDSVLSTKDWNLIVGFEPWLLWLVAWPQGRLVRSVMAVAFEADQVCAGADHTNSRNRWHKGKDHLIPGKRCLQLQHLWRLITVGSLQQSRKRLMTWCIRFEKRPYFC
jgi:hypothetical protein